MPRGSYVPSLTLRLFSTIVLGFVAVNIITLYITSYLKDFTRPVFCGNTDRCRRCMPMR